MFKKLPYAHSDLSRDLKNRLCPEGNGQWIWWDGEFVRTIDSLPRIAKALEEIKSSYNKQGFEFPECRVLYYRGEAKINFWTHTDSIKEVSSHVTQNSV